ncbi:hypothetical protein GC089_12925 [Cellulomonas sp. JZ18]|uniref:hypothetical protein n=1 Tax=Cellulomonas sp. JZ18 TaxID=2654191 RepID=UPI0012D476F6|nr:hypothetical protein [Cellulomonas sp. JZ18]QGQ19953.1 hypothetical protein GC089_12925 [Cellulomonas sp. JZ18]
MGMLWGVLGLGAVTGVALVLGGLWVVRTCRARELRLAPVAATVLGVEGRHLDLGYHLDGRPFRYRGRAARFVQGPLPAVGASIPVHVDPRRPAVAQTPGELRVAGALGWVYVGCGVLLVLVVVVAAVVVAQGW